MEIMSNGRVRRSGTEWRKILDRQSTSGLTEEEFCKKEGISRCTGSERHTRRFGPRRCSMKHSPRPTDARSHTPDNEAKPSTNHPQSRYTQSR